MIRLFPLAIPTTARHCPYAGQKNHNKTDGIYFITFTCYQLLSLVELTKGYDLIYNWFDHLKSCGHCINGYVIMPNHVHALIGVSNTGKLINTIVGNGKRFIAYEIIKRLKDQHEHKLLHQLSIAVEAKDRERNKRHEVWEDSFDWKECRTHKYMQQKLDYMHMNSQFCVVFPTFKSYA